MKKGHKQGSVLPRPRLCSKTPLHNTCLIIGASADEQLDTSQTRHAFLAFLYGISGILRHVEAGRIEALGSSKSLTC